jgi:hypothetical protein
MHLSSADKLRQAARLHASGRCRTISRLCCRTVRTLCISMLDCPNYIRVELMERDLYRWSGCGYYWLPELYLQLRSIPRRGRERWYWNAYSRTFGENWRQVTERDTFEFGIYYVLNGRGCAVELNSCLLYTPEFKSHSQQKTSIVIPRLECHIGGQLIDEHIERCVNQHAQVVTLSRIRRLVFPQCPCRGR